MSLETIQEKSVNLIKFNNEDEDIINLFLGNITKHMTLNM